MNINDLQFQEMRRFAEFGRLSATIIHEISNPLSAAMLQLELSDHQSPSVRKAKRNMQTIRRYVEAARLQISTSGPVKQFSLNPQFEQLKRILLPVARQHRVNLQFGPLPTGSKLKGDPVKFQQIVANLVMNAIQAYDSIEMTQQTSLVQVNLLGDDGWLLVQVHDWGKGITPSEMPKLFEPFYTTKGAGGHGLGIGLAIVKQYVTADFGGSIRLKSTQRGGTQFTVRLPDFTTRQSA